MKKFIILSLIMIILSLTGNLYAYTDFKDYINSPVVNTEKTEDQIRLDWDNFLGYDIFTPYYKLEIFRKSIATKCSFKFENFRTELVTNNLLEKHYSIYYKFIWRFN